MASRKPKSIQAQRKKGNKSGVANLQAATLKKAHRLGIAWDDYEVSRVVTGIEKDETTYEIAMSLGRTYYSVQTTRRTIAFAMRHSSAIWGKK